MVKKKNCIVLDTDSFTEYITRNDIFKDIADVEQGLTLHIMS